MVTRIINSYGVLSVIHLAAQPIVTTASRNPIDIFESNIEGTWTILDAVRGLASVKTALVISSAKVYGNQSEDKLPCSEDYPMQGIFPYDCSKACVDHLVHCYWHTYFFDSETRVGVARCVNFYGGGDFNRRRFIPEKILQGLCGETAEVWDWKNTRQFLYVIDGAMAHLLLEYNLPKLDKKEEIAFNFGADSPINLIDLAHEIESLTDLKLQIKHDNEKDYAPREILHEWVSSDRSETLLGWKPIYSLQEGLESTKRWYDVFNGSGQGLSSITLQLLNEYLEEYNRR